MKSLPYIGGVYKGKKCTFTHDKLENGLVYLYQAFQFNVKNASITYTRIKYAFFTYEIDFCFSMRKSLDIFPSKTCNSSIAINKQRQEHNNLAIVTIQREKLKGAHEFGPSNLENPKTQMQTPTRMENVVNENYYHMTTIDQNVNWMNSHIYYPLLVHLPLLQHF
jgi:hypothetical protein